MPKKPVKREYFPEELVEVARAFKMKVREMLLAPKVQNLIKDRIVAELTDDMDVKITPTILRIGAGSNAAVPSKGTSGNIPKSLNIHLHNMSSEDLRNFAENAKSPLIVPDDQQEVVDVLPEGSGGGDEEEPLNGEDVTDP